MQSLYLNILLNTVLHVSMHFKFSNLFPIEVNLTVTHLQCMYEFIKIIKTVLQINYNRVLVVFPNVIYTHPTKQTNKRRDKKRKIRDYVCHKRTYMIESY